MMQDRSARGRQPQALRLMVREDLRERAHPATPAEHLGEHVAIVRATRHAAVAEQHLVIEPRPGAVDLAALDPAAEHEHGLAVAADIVSAGASPASESGRELPIW